MTNTDNRYDLIFAGGGAAAMMLLYKLMKLPDFQQKKILVVDRQIKKGNERTWSFWTSQATDFDNIVHKSWPNIQFTSTHTDVTERLQKLSYKTIKGIDFFAFVHQSLFAYKNIEWLEADIRQVSCVHQKGLVTLNDGRQIVANYVFDSLFKLSELPQSPKHHTLLQHFYGQVICTPEPAFDKSTARLFDMRIPQEGVVQFVYTLPFSATEALVEYTVFSENTFEKEVYKPRLENYISEYLQLADYQVLEEESGIIPMTDYSFPASGYPQVIHIGIKSGMAKPSTGYAFLRMHREAERQKAFWQKHKRFDNQPPPVNKRFAIYDSMIMDIMVRDGASIEKVFSDMFTNNRIEEVLLFLDEQTHFAQDLKIMASVQSLPFLTSIKNLVLR